MLNVVATLAIIAAIATAPAPAEGASDHQAAARATAHAGVHLTAKQKRWFGRAIEHILSGDR